MSDVESTHTLDKPERTIFVHISKINTDVHAKKLYEAEQSVPSSLLLHMSVKPAAQPGNSPAVEQAANSLVAGGTLARDKLHSLDEMFPDAKIDPIQDEESGSTVLCDSWDLYREGMKTEPLCSKPSETPDDLMLAQQIYFAVEMDYDYALWCNMLNIPSYAAARKARQSSARCHGTKNGSQFRRATK